LFAILPYLPVLRAGFVTWDDDRNFLDNQQFRGLGWEQLRWMWTTVHMGHYIPLSWMTLGLDYSLWGMDARGYHLTNLLLHGACAVLLFRLARQLYAVVGATDVAFPSAVASLLFAVHPLRVESVAWVTERRDVLSLFLYLLAILFYLRHCARQSERRRDYWASLVMFACALLSKGVSVTLPAILLILNAYPLGRIGRSRGWWSPDARRVYLELAPFAAMSIAMSALTVVALHPPDQLNVGAKLAVSAYSLAFYLVKSAVPTNLAPLYEMPKHINALAAPYLLSYALVAVFAAVMIGLRKAVPAVTAALLAFCALLLPMLGVVQNGPQIVADRYTYHAAPALAVLVGGGVLLLAQRHPWRARFVGLAALLPLSALTWRQTLIWQDSERMWTRVLSVDSTSSIAHIALGTLMIKGDRVREALTHYQAGVRYDSAYAEGHNNLGVALVRLGRAADALEHYRAAARLKTGYDEAEVNWGAALAQMGNTDEAIEHYREALRINPGNANAHVNWGNALTRLHLTADAIAHYREAVRLRPLDADAECNWGVALAQSGRFADALPHFRAALLVDPMREDAKRFASAAEAALRAQRGGAPVTASPIPRR
jgi:tetratricopeptide (TPR) repeat protein